MIPVSERPRSDYCFPDSYLCLGCKDHVNSNNSLTRKVIFSTGQVSQVDQ